MGWVAVHNGYFWIISYNARLGTVTNVASLEIAAVGAVFLVIGVVPWPKGPGKSLR